VSHLTPSPTHPHTPHPRRSIPSRQSTCTLEVDASVHDILNRQEATHVPLQSASPDMQLVASLVPMWQAERWRLGGSSIPPPPASPSRRPRPLCPSVEAVREEFKVSASFKKSDSCAVTSYSGTAWYCVVCNRGAVRDAVKHKVRDAGRLVSHVVGEGSSKAG
jgi:hypothetical protein